ncbi:39S ribosomal protein L42, mitochondrial isoform X3 [Neoarius graeffei]|uniref:39S ribosomal protein L42, mitochondrial isoform X3 n=1 Tax=Neoarius graeffei TaxID=443677 RepID=UPI00298BD366|nr:39S ribosomal protein L42, mitochondrial isoform X3 [Neoarius graeffei]
MATWSHVNWLPFMLTRVCCNANKHLFQVKARVLSLHPATRNHNTNNRFVKNYSSPMYSPRSLWMLYHKDDGHNKVGEHHARFVMDVDLGVTCDGETIVCFHHAPDIPHELTKPIPNPDTTLDSAETHDLVLKSRLNKDVLKGKKTPTAEELAKMFYTTKHRWYPVGQYHTRRRNRNPPQDR